MSTGTVCELDGDGGSGVIRADDGTLVAFHVGSLVDGVRRVGLGERVWFGTVLRLGRAEAVRIERGAQPGSSDEAVGAGSRRRLT